MRIRMSSPKLRENRWVLHDRVPVDVVSQHKGTTVTIRLANTDTKVTLGDQVKLSLRTSDRQLAIERYRDASAQLAHAYSMLRQASATGAVRLTDRQCNELAGAYFEEVVAAHIDDPGTEADWDGGRTAADELGETPEGRNAMHGEAASRLLLARGMLPDPESRTRLLQAMHRAFLDASHRIAKWAEGDFSAMTTGRESYPQPVPVAALPSLTLADVKKRWVDDKTKQGNPEKTINTFRHHFDHLINFLGGDDQKDANSVTPDDIEAWLTKLEGQDLSRKTISDSYLTLVKAGFAMSKRKLVKWPFEGVTLKVPKKTLGRSKGFTPSETAAILSAASEGRGVGDRVKPPLRRAHRWVPWLCAYTGARVSEIVQLRKADFRDEHGVKYIVITPEAGSTKTGLFRYVPLHPHLLEQGLWDAIDVLLEGYVFLSVTGEKASAKAITTVGNRLREWIREEAVGVTDKSVQPNHAWRHRFITEARGRMSDETRDTITGHVDGRASAGYGETDMRVLMKAINAIPRIAI